MSYQTQGFQLKTNRQIDNEKFRFDFDVKDQSHIYFQDIDNTMAINQSNLEIDQSCSMILKDDAQTEKVSQIYLGKQENVFNSKHFDKSNKIIQDHELLQDLFKNAFFLKDRTIFTKQEANELPYLNCKKYLSHLSDNQKLKFFELIQLSFIEQTYGAKNSFKILRNISKNNEQQIEYISDVKSKIIDDEATRIIQEEVKIQQQKEQEFINQQLLELEQKRLMEQYLKEQELKKQKSIQQSLGQLFFDKLIKRIDIKKKIKALDEIQEVYSHDEISALSLNSQKQGRMSTIQSMMKKLKRQNKRQKEKLQQQFISLNQSEKSFVNIEFQPNFAKTQDFQMNFNQMFTNDINDQNTQTIKNQSPMKFSQTMHSQGLPIQFNNTLNNDNIFQQNNFQDLNVLNKSLSTFQASNNQNSPRSQKYQNNVLQKNFESIKKQQSNLYKTQNLQYHQILSVSNIDSLEDDDSRQNNQQLMKINHSPSQALRLQDLISSDTSYLSSNENQLQTQIKLKSEQNFQLHLDSEEGCQNNIIVDFQQQFVQPQNEISDIVHQRLISEDGVNDDEEVYFQNEPHKTIAEFQKIQQESLRITDLQDDIDTELKQITLLQMNTNNNNNDNNVTVINSQNITQVTTPTNAITQQQIQKVESKKSLKKDFSKSKIHDESTLLKTIEKQKSQQILNFNPQQPLNETLNNSTNNYQSITLKGMKRSESQQTFTSKFNKPPTSSIKQKLSRQNNSVILKKLVGNETDLTLNQSQQQLYNNLSDSENEVEGQIFLKNKLKDIHNKKKQLEEKMKKRFLQRQENSLINEATIDDNYLLSSKQNTSFDKRQQNLQIPNLNQEVVNKNQNISFHSRKSNLSKKSINSKKSVKSKKSNTNSIEKHNINDIRRYKMYTDTFQQEKNVQNIQSEDNNNRIKKLMKKIKEKRLRNSQLSSSNDIDNNINLDETLILNRQNSEQSITLNLKLSGINKFLPNIIPTQNMQLNNQVMMKSNSQTVLKTNKNIDQNRHQLIRNQQVITNSNENMNNSSQNSNYNMSVNFNFNGANTFFEKILNKNNNNNQENIYQLPTDQQNLKPLGQSKSQAFIPTIKDKTKNNLLFQPSQKSILQNEEVNINNSLNNDHELNDVIMDLNSQNQIKQQAIDEEPRQIGVFTFYHEKSDNQKVNQQPQYDQNDDSISQAISDTI